MIYDSYYFGAIDFGSDSEASTASPSVLSSSSSFDQVLFLNTSESLEDELSMIPGISPRVMRLRSESLLSLSEGTSPRSTPIPITLRLDTPPAAMHQEIDEIRSGFFANMDTLVQDPQLLVKGVYSRLDRFRLQSPYRDVRVAATSTLELIQLEVSRQLRSTTPPSLPPSPQQGPPMGPTFGHENRIF